MAKKNDNLIGVLFTLAITIIALPIYLIVWIVKTIKKNNTEQKYISVCCEKEILSDNNIESTNSLYTSQSFNYKEFINSIELDEKDINTINDIVNSKYSNSTIFLNEVDFLEQVAQWKLDDFEFVFKLIKQIMYLGEVLYIQRSLELFINYYKKNNDNRSEEFWERIALEELKILPYFIEDAKKNGYNTGTKGIKYLCQKYKKDNQYEKVAELSRIAIILNLDDGTTTGYLGRLENAKKHCGESLFTFDIGYSSKTLPNLLKNIKTGKKKSNLVISRLSNFVENYIVIDIETTGLNPEYAEIIQLCAVKYINNKEVEKFNVLVKPKEFIPEHITQINGIDNKMVKNANSISDELPKFMEFIKDAILIGHNIRFDLGFIDMFCNKLGLEYAKFTVVDTLYLSRKFFKLENYKLETVGKFLNCDFTYHRAYNDCIATNTIYQYIKNQKGN